MRLGRGLELSRRAQEQLRTEFLSSRAIRLLIGRLAEAEFLRRRRKAAAFHRPHKGPQAIYPVHQIIPTGNISYSVHSVDAWSSRTALRLCPTIHNEGGTDLKRQIGIVGAGVAGLHLGSTCSSMVSMQPSSPIATPEEYRDSRLLNTVAHHHVTIAREDYLGVNHWTRSEVHYYQYHDHYFNFPHRWAFAAISRSRAGRWTTASICRC